MDAGQTNQQQQPEGQEGTAPVRRRSHLSSVLHLLQMGYADHA
jgi:hypothetical protein